MQVFCCYGFDNESVKGDRVWKGLFKDFIFRFYVRTHNFYFKKDPTNSAATDFNTYNDSA